MKEFLDSLNSTQQSKIIRTIQNIEEFGLETVKSKIKKISGTPLWEIRITGKDAALLRYKFIIDH
ncbi:type II toxin-antitoxin system RelE/ParE family toxin [Patescibacteria group bacterium]|nr:type II toxin-antitoxin system RelE/ParE family toxin [Patescibacteria group bacterium]